MRLYGNKASSPELRCRIGRKGKGRDHRAGVALTLVASRLDLSQRER
jgi:hypothetical protein